MAKHLKTLNVIYYKYYLMDNERKETYRHDIRKLLKNFVSIENTDFKNNFKNHSDNYYLIPINVSDSYSVDFYYFLSTRNNDIAKIIETNKNNINVNDIEKKLQSNQQLGFSSFIMVDADYIALSSSFLSPKSTNLNGFISQILRSQGVKDSMEFRLETFPLSITKEEALTMGFIGKTTFKVKKSGAFAQQLIRLFNTNPDGLDSMEITFTPKRNKDITELSKEIIENVADDTDTKKLIIKAKEEVSNTIQEYYILNYSKLKDTLKVETDLDVCHSLYEKAQGNALLLEDLIEFRNENKKTECNSIIHLNKLGAWNYTVNTSTLL